MLLPPPSRDRTSLQLSNRRLERKVKELVMQVDDEHLSLTDQKDQVRTLCKFISDATACPRLGSRRAARPLWVGDGTGGWIPVLPLHPVRAQSGASLGCLSEDLGKLQTPDL